LVLLQDVVLKGAGQTGPFHATRFGNGHVHGQQDGRRPVDGHRGGDPTEVDVGKQVGHVVERVYGHPGPAHLTDRPFVIGVVSHKGGHVEGGGQAGAAGL